MVFPFSRCCETSQASLLAHPYLTLADDWEMTFAEHAKSIGEVMGAPCKARNALRAFNSTVG